ncbi:prolyl oligopeptidase family serine peptidase [Kamptonema cortianum]|nr:prolyl oligopeptidase family serine peptidase [Geitlerinema splendidum]MDK3156140.1 prolyl oligopeptidase family serine peptidase [Kamptonema cortianum]
MIHALGLAMLLAYSTPSDKALPAFKPTATEVAQLYHRHDSLPTRVAGTVTQANLQHSWLSDDELVYRKQSTGQEFTYLSVDTSTGRQTPAFDHQKLAQDLNALSGTRVDPKRLSIAISRLEGKSGIVFQYNSKTYLHDRATGKTEILSEPSRQPRQPNQSSPDGKWRFRINDGKVEVLSTAGEQNFLISPESGFTTATWSPDSSYLIATRVLPGDRKMVYRLLSNQENATRAVLQQGLYDQPGDKLDTAEYWIAKPGDWKAEKVKIDPVMCGGQPWSNAPRIDWWQPDGAAAPKAMLSFNIRGYQQHKIIEIDPSSLQEKAWVHEISPTFIHTSQMIQRKLQKQPAIIWRSERDGWGHLYLFKEGSSPKQITRGEFIVRSVQHIDEDAGKIFFTANGREKGDPYFIHSYSVKFDGSELRCLTSGEGTHSVDWSPGNKYFVDSYSSPILPHIHELRDASGKLVTMIAKSDVTEYRLLNIPDPEPFVAKGRDGKTDIYGLIYKPSNFDSTLSYPVIEDIYAGPHDSHVPKNFRVASSQQRLAEMGFFVVQIDGMGTANRGKAFHDVCWKNIADAGLPDRILWIKEAAKKHPSMDLSRVGIYGTSAGGQNSTGALLFHPEFYKVAVSSCGCHDNRIDKQWWNEQWMGYPVGPHYEEQSNITNAHKLQGKLMLMVGEVDSNVPPESTFRLVDALMKARKDFEFIYLPGLNHTGGGAYGDRKRRDFFVRHLHQVDPLPMSSP